MKQTIILFFLLFLILSPFTAYGQAENAPMGATSPGLSHKQQQALMDEAKKALEKSVQEAMETTKGLTGRFNTDRISSHYTFGEEIVVQFMTRDYQPIHAGQGGPITGAGKAIYRVEKTDSYDKLGREEAGPSKRFLVYTISLKGNTANSGNPAHFEETGTDPSPLFFLVDSKSVRYPAETWDAVRQKNKEFPKRYKKMLSIKMNEAQWSKTAIAFKVPTNISKPVLVNKVRGKKRQYSYIGVK